MIVEDKEHSKKQERILRRQEQEENAVRELLSYQVFQASKNNLQFMKSLFEDWRSS